MKAFKEWWESYRFDPGTIDQAFEDAFRAGMLAAADICEDAKQSALDRSYVLAAEIRKRAK